VYLAAIMDLYSGFVVGWALPALNDRHLAMRALDMALEHRCPMEGPLHHQQWMHSAVGYASPTAFEAAGRVMVA